VTGPPRAATRRVFFALWPEARERRALAQATACAVASSGGEAVPPDNLHLTLVFLGSIPAARTAELAALGCRVAHEHTGAPLELAFERLAHWAEPQILCALPGGESAALGALAGALRDAAVTAGFLPDLKPFRAHVTVARKVVRAPASPELAAVTWRHRACALIQSRTDPAGSVYSVLETCVLGKSGKVRTLR